MWVGRWLWCVNPPREGTSPAREGKVSLLGSEENVDYAERQSKGKNGPNSMSQKRKERKRYRQIDTMDQCPRTWLSSETHRQRVRNNSQNLQQGKFWSFTRKNVSQSAWISTEAGRSETFRPCLEKALSDLTSLCINFTGRLDWRPLGVPSNLSGSLILDEKCTKGGDF